MLSPGPLPPAHTGDSLDEIDTPAAIIDLDVFEDNVKRSIHLLDELGSSAHSVMLRPHLKATKCVELARLQLSLSHGRSVGVCCQKLCEAEAMLDGGISNILVSNEVVGPKKIARLIRLCGLSSDISVLVDDASNVDAIAAAAEASKVSVKVLIELDVGQNRCGVANVEELVSLAQHIHTKAHLRFGGIQAYHGGVQHERSFERRREICAAVAGMALRGKMALEAAGFKCDCITGGGTGTFPLEATTGVFTELQPGSYAVMDADYARNLDVEGRALKDSERGFRSSLFLLSTVMSIRRPPLTAPISGQNSSSASSASSSSASSTSSSSASEASSSPPSSWFVIDSGLKAQSTDSGLPSPYCLANHYPPKDPSQVMTLYMVKSVSDEHSTLILKGEAAAAAAAAAKERERTTEVSLGSKILLIPGHCDPFVNHFDFVCGIRGGKVEGVFRLYARSPGI